MKRYLILLCLIPQVVQADQEVSTSGAGLSQLAGYIALFLVVMVCIYLITKRESKRSVYHEMYASLREKLRSDVGFEISSRIKSVDTNKPSSTKTVDLEKELDSLKSKIEQLEKRLQDSPEPPATEQQTIAAVLPEEPAVEKKPEVEDVFFLSSPNPDGSFNVSSVQPYYKPSASIYWFKKIEVDKAIFKIDGRETSMRLALQYADKIIDPVCESINGLNSSTKKIVTEPGHEGHAHLSGDKWLLVTKAKISYE